MKTIFPQKTPHIYVDVCFITALYGRQTERLTAEMLGQLVLALGGTQKMLTKMSRLYQHPMKQGPPLTRNVMNNKRKRCRP